MKLFRSICALKDPVVKPKPISGCLNVPAEKQHKPDPCIYSQREAFSNGSPAVWENPDVRLIDLATGIVQRSTFGIGEGRTFRIEVTVKNCSPDTVAHNARLQVFQAPYGIGGYALGITEIPLTAPFANIQPNGAVVLYGQWTSPVFSASFLARVSHPDDRSALNNEGWHTVRFQEFGDGSPIFPIWNPFSGVRFIKVYIREEGPDKWFPSEHITIGSDSSFLPTGALPDMSHVIDGHLAGLYFDPPDGTPAGTYHTAHLTAVALADLNGPEQLIGGVTFTGHTNS